MENNEVDVEETNVDTTNQEIDYKALYEEKEAKVGELEGLIQKHKKKEKPTTESNVDIDSLLEGKLAERDFYSKNPDMSEYKEKINDFTSKGLTHEQAKKLVIDADPTIQNRATAQNSNFTDGNPDFSTGVYSMEQLAEIGKKSPSKYAELMRDYKSGKIKVT